MASIAATTMLIGLEECLGLRMRSGRLWKGIEGRLRAGCSSLDCRFYTKILSRRVNDAAFG